MFYKIRRTGKFQSCFLFGGKSGSMENLKIIQKYIDKLENLAYNT